MERSLPEKPVKPEPIQIIADPFIPDNPGLERVSKESYWRDNEGNWRRDIIEKSWQILRGRY